MRRVSTTRGNIMTKMTYEEWRNKINPPEITDVVKAELLKYHDINADLEIENALRREYQYYLEKQ
jgi:hypothetical protein